MSTQSDIREALTAAAGGATALSLALPEPAATVARVTAAALGTAAALVDQGQTPEQVIQAMHRARRIDTAVEDAAVDAMVAAKPSALTDAAGKPITAAEVLSPSTVAILPPKPSSSAT